jgi:cell cycle sensor histidine kinase DivJ
MRIDWNETLIGAESAGTEPVPRATARVLASLRLGRLAGILASALLLAGAFILLPSGSASALSFLTAASGLLLANVLGFVALDRLGTRGVLAARIAAFSGLMPAAVLSFPAAIGMMAVLACESLWQREAARARTEWLSALAVGALGIVGIAIAYTRLSPFASALLIASLVPLMVSAVRLFALRSLAEAEQRRTDRMNRAFIDLALSRLPERQLVVDAAGRVEPLGPDATFARRLAAEQFAGADLIETVLIADRPKVLQALSDVLHRDAGSLTVIARTCDPMADQRLQPPTYRAHRLTMIAAPGIADRAIVLVESAERRNRQDDKAVIVGPTGTLVEALRPQSPDTELLARALHDSVSPFNAGLGYLEMITDPRLAPQEIGPMRHYAGEAAAAIREAHRNATLMGRWLKLDALGDNPRSEHLKLADAVTDMMRALHLVGPPSPIEFRLAPDISELSLSAVPDRVRFAIAVYLRGLAALGQKGGRITLHARHEGADLHLAAVIEPQPRNRAAGDMFQLALERVAKRHANVRFELAPDGAPGLVLADVVTGATAAPTPRLAS